MLIFVEGGKTGEPGEKPLGKDEKQQTRPTYDSGSGNRHIGGRRALSPLRQPCSPPKKN